MVHPPSLLARRSQQQQAEQEEEYITNRLMKRLAQLKQEKEDLARQVEVEEEMITNKLSKKLEQAPPRPALSSPFTNHPPGGWWPFACSASLPCP